MYNIVFFIYKAMFIYTFLCFCCFLHTLIVQRWSNKRKNKRLIAVLHLKIIYVFNDDHISYHMHGHNQGRQENFWAPGQKETWPPSSNSPNNDTQTKSTTVCHKQGIGTTKMNGCIVI